MEENILEVEDLKTHFFTRRGVVKAVDGVSFSVGKGETLGLVGESACGKTITCLSILRLVPQPAGRIVSGKIIMDGHDLLQKSESEMEEIRGSQISMILQDPMTSLNPVFTVGQQVAWPIRLHQKLNRKAIQSKVREMLSRVKIPSPEVRAREYPHQMSGGMRQRIVGAMALSCQPGLLIADEPTTALDVTIQAQFLKLIDEIQHDSNLGMIVVTHDFGIVAKVCDRVAVMYAGRIVEEGTTAEVFANPLHPYTRGLLKSMPRIDTPLQKSLYAIPGLPPDLGNLPVGCPFHPRCDLATDQCFKTYPDSKTVSPTHRAACWEVEAIG